MACMHFNLIYTKTGSNVVYIYTLTICVKDKTGFFCSKVLTTSMCLNFTLIIRGVSPFYANIVVSMQVYIYPHNTGTCVK